MCGSHYRIKPIPFAVSLVILGATSLSPLMASDKKEAQDDLALRAVEDFGKAINKLFGPDQPVIPDSQKNEFVKDARSAVGAAVFSITELEKFCEDSVACSNRNAAEIIYSFLFADVYAWSHGDYTVDEDIALLMTRKRADQALSLYPLASSPDRPEMISILQILGTAAKLDKQWVTERCCEYMQENEDKMDETALTPIVVALHCLQAECIGDISFPKLTEEALKDDRSRLQLYLEGVFRSYSDL